MMIERAAAWLESAGVKVPRKPDGSVDATIEIAPSFALDKADVAAKRDRIPPSSRETGVSRMIANCGLRIWTARLKRTEMPVTL